MVWDKSASIRFRRPGVGTVKARFEIPRDQIDAIREMAIRDGKAETQFSGRYAPRAIRYLSSSSRRATR